MNSLLHCIRKSAFAYLGGINVEYLIKEKLSLKLDLNYERKRKREMYIRDIDNNGSSKVYNFTSKKIMIIWFYHNDQVY
jgi:hypothetical protein